MMENKKVATAFTICATSSGKVKDLPIKNGQLIFVQDNGRIAFDFKGKRVFYNQITELNTEQDRQTLAAPANGYYFVIETASLWYYGGSWNQITTTTENTVYIGSSLPASGNAKMLYVNKSTSEILIWDALNGKYQAVADKTAIMPISGDDIRTLF